MSDDDKTNEEPWERAFGAYAGKREQTYERLFQLGIKSLRLAMDAARRPPKERWELNGSKRLNAALCAYAGRGKPVCYSHMLELTEHAMKVAVPFLLQRTEELQARNKALRKAHERAQAQRD